MTKGIIESIKIPGKENNSLATKIKLRLSIANMTVDMIDANDLGLEYPKFLNIK